MSFNPANRPSKPWVKEKEIKEANNPNIAELRVAGKCFKCRESWVPGHAKTCKGKQAYSIIMIENSEGKEVAVIDGQNSEEVEFQDGEAVPVLNVSMHALCEATPQSNTFTLRLHIVI